MPSSSENVSGVPVPKLVQVHVPWSQTEIPNMVATFSNIRYETAKFKEELETIIEAYNTTWTDLIHAICPKGIWERLKEKAAWPTQAPEPTALVNAHLQLLTNITEVCPIKTDWSKIKTCKQQDCESPAEFMECLMLAFEQHSGVKDPCTNAREGMVSFFVDGLHPKISEAI